MIKDFIDLDCAFEPYRMGRIDSIIGEMVSHLDYEKGIVTIKCPDGVILTSIEFEPNLVDDYIDAFKNYENQIKHSVPDYFNRKIYRKSVSIPFNMGRLVLGDWQQIVFLTLEKVPDIRFQLEISLSDSILGMESIFTNREFQVLDVTDIIERSLKNYSSYNVALVSPEPNVLLITLEPGLSRELISLLQRIAPYEKQYRHHHPWNDHVGFIHVRASFFSQILSLEIDGGELKIGNEKLFLVELDTSPARRDIYFDVWK